MRTWKSGAALWVACGVTLGGLAAPLPAWAEEGPQSQRTPSYPFEAGVHELSLSLGYGVGFQMGRPNPELEEVQLLAITPRWAYGLSDPRGVDRWWAYNFQLLLEGTFLIELEPVDGWAAGASILARSNLLAPRKKTRLVPYVEAGVGMLSLDFGLADQDDGFSFSVLVGAGARYMLTSNSSLTFEWRWHHISNANTHTPNHGINTNVLALAYSRFF